MKTIGIIAEFNPFHNGHKYLIEKAKQETGADYCVVVMSGDFVQRGAPAITDKFTRTKMALSCRADLVIELPVYYSLGSAEFFASGAVSILDSLGVIDYLCFGSESGDLAMLSQAAEILSDEPENFKEALNKNLKSGKSFPAARQAALSEISDFPEGLLDSPNNILAIEYLKALYRRKSNITPFTVTRKGEGFHSDTISAFASASALRKAVFERPEDINALSLAIPKDASTYLTDHPGKFIDSNDFSRLLNYKLIQESSRGFTDYLDISEDLSNKIAKQHEITVFFTDLCNRLKSKDLSYSRISRSLFHILLNITCKNMEEYKNDNYTSYARILGLKKESSALLAQIHKTSDIPVIDRLKDASNLLNPLQLRLFNETLSAGKIYNMIAENGISSEFSLKSIIL